MVIIINEQEGKNKKSCNGYNLQRQDEVNTQFIKKKKIIQQFKLVKIVSKLRFGEPATEFIRTASIVKSPVR